MSGLNSNTRRPEKLRGFRGEVISSADSSYDEARAIWNADIDRRPTLVVQPLDTDDVVTALAYAADEGLKVSVRGGGHHVAGLALSDGVVIDLHQMRRVALDVDHRRAHVQGGATWADVDSATQPHGLVVPGGVVSETGVGGLTLGGGLGWLRRSLGLSSDQIVGFEVVLADGTKTHVNADQHADLFSALRGGGGGLAVVTDFEFALHSLGPQVWFVAATYLADAAMEILQDYRDFAEQATDEVTTSVLLGTAPAIPPYPQHIWGRDTVTIAAMYSGPVEAGKSHLERLQRLANIEPVLDLSGQYDYRFVQSMFDAAYPSGQRYYWTSLYIDDLPDTALHEVLTSAARKPSAASIVALWQLGGALRRQPPTPDAYRGRNASFLLGVEANAVPAGDDAWAAHTAWAHQCVEALVPFSNGEQYLNLLDSNNAIAAGVARPDFDALRQRYDPSRLFG